MTRLATLLGSILTLVFMSTIAVAQEYRVQPGDSLAVEVIEDPTLNRTVLVAPDGRIALPGTGTIRAGGLTLRQIEANISGRLSANFINPPNVFVGVAGIAPEEDDPVLAIFVVGEATTVGRLEIEPGTTLLQAVAQFGGFTNFAAIKRIQLRRGTEMFTLDYNKIVDGSSRNGLVRMHEGDVIIIPQRKLFE